MKLSSLESAIADYERITGEHVPLEDYTEQQAGCFYDPQNHKYFKVLPSNEWLIWAIGEREGLSYLWLDQSYGFMKHFVPFLLNIMDVAGLEWIVTATTRNPKAHIRKWAMFRLPEYDYEYDGRHYFVLKGHKTNLK